LKYYDLDLKGIKITYAPFKFPKENLFMRKEENFLRNFQYKIFRNFFNIHNTKKRSALNKQDNPSSKKM